MPQLRILDSTGDTVIDWQPNDPESIVHARTVFCQMHAQRRMAFSIPPGKDASHGEQIRTFDDTSDHDIVFVRPIAGGS